jgi:hypothetical protein
MDSSERQQNFLKNETQEQKRQRLDKNANSTKDLRAKESDQQKRQRLDKNANSTKDRRAKESDQEQNRRLNQDATSTKDRRAKESDQEQNRWLNQVATSTKDRRANESVEEHNRRVNQVIASNATKRKGKADKIATEGFVCNFNLPFSFRNPFYKNWEYFKNSHNKYDWQKAIAQSWHFGHRRQPGYNSLEFHWSEECGFCHASCLKGSSKTFRMKCCKHSQIGSCEELQPLIPEIVTVLQTSSNFGRQSHGYNNRLSFGATGVDNGKGGKFENKGPVSCVTIAGRLYHILGDQNSLTISD